MNNFETLIAAIKDSCREQNRYRTLIVLGKPQSGKTTLLKKFSSQYNWNYINYTFQHGFFDTIEDIENYNPENLKQRILVEMDEFVSKIPGGHAKGLVIDQLEGILATWRTDIQDIFFRMICGETRLPCGLIIPIRIRQEPSAILHCIKNQNQIFNLTGE